MIEINSVNNELVKETAKLQQKKFRNLENKFILEGYKVIKEAFDSNIKIDKIFVQKGFEDKYSFLKEKLIFSMYPFVILLIEEIRLKIYNLQLSKKKGLLY